MEHISNPELRAFFDRQLPPDRLLEVDDHLAVCLACRAALEREARVGPAVAGLQVDFAATEPHLEYEQLLGLAEGRKVPAEVEHHAKLCSSCAHEVEELRKFVAETDKVSRVFRVVDPVVPRARIARWLPNLIWSGLAAAILLGAGLYWLGSHHAPPGGTTVASLRDGDHELSLDKSGKLHGAEGLEPGQQEAMQTAMASGRLAVNEPSNFTTPQQETLLGAPVAAASFKVISPVGQVVIDDRPTFTWEPMPTANGYRVRVYAAGYRKIAESPLVPGTAWQATTSLPRGNSFTWTVTAESPKGEVRAPAPPQPEAAFQVIDTDTAAALVGAANSHRADHLLLAILYARAGVTNEARAQLDQLAVQNPGSKLVDQLKSSLNQAAPSPIRTNAAQ
jgi:hypothetical protein